MEINPNRFIRPVQKSVSKSRIEHAQAKNPDAVGETSFVGSDLLSLIETGLESLPEVRQERLESGKHLASDPNYPNEEDLEELSKLTLKNLPTEEEEDYES